MSLLTPPQKKSHLKKESLSHLWPSSRLDGMPGLQGSQCPLQGEAGRAEPLG